MGISHFIQKSFNVSNEYTNQYASPFEAVFFFEDDPKVFV
jgi:hypothetical protein